MKNDLAFDVVVIGGGHAGCEAAAASARWFPIKASISDLFLPSVTKLPRDWWALTLRQFILV